MNLIISQFTLEDDDSLIDRRDINAFTEKLRQRFKVCARPVSKHERFNEFVVTFIGYSQDAMSQKMDSIAEFCEKSGMGRVADEQTFLDDIENLLEENS